jgi:heptaprenyl diphosphate synthase
MLKKFLQLSVKQKKAVAFLGAATLFLAMIEYLFPKPAPFIRLGLANLPLLLVIDRINIKTLIYLTLLKVFGQGLLNGTLGSYVFLFSFCGSFASAFLMYSVYRFVGKYISLVGLSIIGALSSNLVQVVLSVVFIFGPNSWIIVPVFLITGLVSGSAIGFLALQFSLHSTWLNRLGKDLVSV